MNKITFFSVYSKMAKKRIFLIFVDSDLKIIVSATIYFRGPVGSMEGPRLDSDPMGVGSCVLRVPWYGFCCLECKNIAYIVDFLWWAIWPPLCLIKDSETSVWWGLRLNHCLVQPPLCIKSYIYCYFDSHTSFRLFSFIRYKIQAPLYHSHFCYKDCGKPGWFGVVWE